MDQTLEMVIQLYHAVEKNRKLLAGMPYNGNSQRSDFLRNLLAK